MDAAEWSWEQAQTAVASPGIDRMIGAAVDIPVVAVELGDHHGTEIAKPSGSASRRVNRGGQRC